VKSKVSKAAHNSSHLKGCLGSKVAVPTLQRKATPAAVISFDAKIAMFSLKIRLKLLLFLIAQLTRFCLGRNIHVFEPALHHKTTTWKF